MSIARLTKSHITTEKQTPVISDRCLFSKPSISRSAPNYKDTRNEDDNQLVVIVVRNNETFALEYHAVAAAVGARISDEAMLDTITCAVENAISATSN